MNQWEQEPRNVNAPDWLSEAPAKSRACFDGGTLESEKLWTTVKRNHNRVKPLPQDFPSGLSH
jgi:hypothetical protein